MIFMGKIVGTEVGLNTEGDNDVRLVTVEITDPDDLQTVENFLAGGIDYNPSDNVVALVDDAGDSYKTVVGFDDGITPEVDRGEIEIYSTESDGSAKSARVKCDNQGNVEINGDADNAVRFSKLQEAFDQLKSEYDDVAEKLNQTIDSLTQFFTAYVPGGPTAVGSPSTWSYTVKQANSSTADIDPSKVDEVKLP
jgi:hypothetical protein